MTYRNEMTDRLFNAVLSLESLEECYNFFEDICTIKEITEISQRLEIACRLRDKNNYLTISREVGVSTSTISRVNRALMYGSGGYKTVLDRLENGEDNDGDK